MTQLSAFEDKRALTFEDFKRENGEVYWWASDLLKMVGYKDLGAFEKVLDRATKAMISLGIPHYSNIQLAEREVDGVGTKDFKLTRFACYLAVMNGDRRNPRWLLLRSISLNKPGSSSCMWRARPKWIVC